MMKEHWEFLPNQSILKKRKLVYEDVFDDEDEIYIPQKNRVVKKRLRLKSVENQENVNPNT